MNDKRSYTEYTVTTATTDFVIGFDDYDDITKDTIVVTVNGVLAESQGYAVMRKNAQVITITPAVQSGTVRLERVTDIDESFHQFTAGALFSAKSVDENFEQVRHSQQEVRDGFEFLEFNTNGIISDAKAATDRANAAAELAENTDVVQLQIDLNLQKFDTGITATAQGVGMVARTQAQVNLESISILRFGVDITGATDSTAAFTKALVYCDVNNVALDLLSSTILTSGGHSYSGTLISKSATIKRTASYSGTSELLNLGDNSVIIGDLILDGNYPSEVGQNLSSLVVSGDNVRIQTLRPKNTPCTFLLNTQLRGISVRGDNCIIDTVDGDNCGYSTVQLLLEKALNSFTINNLISKDHDYKAFVINGAVGSIDTARLGNVYTNTSTIQDASDCILVDTQSDNTIQNVTNFHIDNAVCNGAKSNAIKVENVVNFTFGTLTLTTSPTAVSASSAARFTSKNVVGNSITTNKGWLKSSCENFSVGDVFFNSPNNPNVFRLENPYFTTINSFSVGRIYIQNTGVLTQIVGVDYGTATPLHIELGNVFKMPSLPMFGNFGGTTTESSIKSGSCKIVNNISGITQDAMWGSTTNSLSRITQVKTRVFYGSAIPTVGTFIRGDYVTHNNPRVLTDASGNYVTRGWICTTVGTDAAAVWTEDRLRVS